MLTGSWTYRTVPTLGWYKIFLKPLVWLIFVFIKEQNNIDNLDSNSQLGVYSHNHKTRGLILSQNNVLLLLFENGIHFWASIWLDLFWIQKYIFPFEVGFDNCATFQTWSILKHVSAAFSNLDRTRQILQN